MYSRNDYRYYLEYQLILSDDFLAHYGVKGMKWKNRKGGLNDRLEQYRRKHRIKNSIFNKDMWKKDPAFDNGSRISVSHDEAKLGKVNPSSTPKKQIQRSPSAKKKNSRISVTHDVRIEPEKKGSSEYREEKAYNSKKNKVVTGKTSKPKKVRTVKPKGSSEYYEELNANSKKNKRK